METTLRGILEKEIEEFTHPDVLGDFIISFTKRFPTKSLEDCLYGLAIGFIFGRFASLTKIMGRTPTKAEVKEFWDIIERRTMYIKGQIKLALGR